MARHIGVWLNRYSIILQLIMLFSYFDPHIKKQDFALSKWMDKQSEYDKCSDI